MFSPVVCCRIDCLEEFTPTHRSQGKCLACRKKPSDRNCKKCGKKFSPVKGERYCSEECKRVPKRECDHPKCSVIYQPKRTLKEVGFCPQHRGVCRDSCAGCQKRFIPRKKRERYCPDCAEIPERTCENPNCGKHYRPKTRSGICKYCPDCRGYVADRDCARCGKTFSPRGYWDVCCSEDCRKANPPRLCNVPDCTNKYVPVRDNQMYCSIHKKGQLKAYRVERHTKKRHEILGRVCRWCFRSDEEVGFAVPDECLMCYASAGKHGRCNPCEGRPKIKKRRPKPYCPNCSPEPVPESYKPVFLVWGDNCKVVYRSPNIAIYIKGRKTQLRHLRQDPLVMEVDSKAFFHGWVNRPYAVRGVTEWSNPAINGQHPVLLRAGKISWAIKRLLSEIVPSAAEPLTFDWWRSNFKAGASDGAAFRGWERLKRRLSREGIPYTLFDPLTGREAVVGSRPTSEAGAKWVIKFDVPVLQNLVKQPGW